jgi:hypothetical protein
MPLLAAAAVVLGPGLSATAATAEIIRIDTFEQPIRPGLENQGWWPPTLGFSNFTPTDRYFIGRTSPGLDDTEVRSFFSFYVDPATLAGRTPETATLLIQRYGTFTDDPLETVGFFDVGTPADELANNVMTDVAIWNDLGSGTSYGTFDVLAGGSPSDVLSFALNDAALSAIAAAGGGYFSVGAAVLTGDGIVFAGGEPAGVQALELRFLEVAEPGALGLLVIGVAGATMLRRRQSSRFAAPPDLSARPGAP